jgi:CMP-N-acetylneuraminic acid synthetase
MTSTGTIAFIPARRGSISIPRKNLVLLDGKPLIQYSIDAAKEARVFDRIIVSTNDGGVMEVASCAGLEIHDRPESFATASSRVVEAVEHASTVMQLSQDDTVCVLQPTSPLRTSRDVIDAIDLHRRHNQSSVVSVVEAEHHPLKTVTIDTGRIQAPFGRVNLETSRQSLQQVFRVNGAIFISRLESILRHHSLVPEEAIAFVMSSENSVDVDSYGDLAFAEFLLSRRT